MCWLYLPIAGQRYAATIRSGLFRSLLFIFSMHAAPGRRGESQQSRPHLSSPAPEHTRGPDLPPVTRLATELGLHASERTPAGPWRWTPVCDEGAFVLLDGSFAWRSLNQSLGNDTGVMLILHRRTLLKDSFTKRLGWRVLKGFSELWYNWRWRFQQVVSFFGSGI